MRKGVQGIVDLEFSVNEHGRAYDVRQTYAESGTLGRAAEEQLRAGTFRVNKGWKEKGYSRARLNIEFHYRLAEKDSPCGTGATPKTRLPDVESVVICSGRLP